jgi:hypothetical protein
VRFEELVGNWRATPFAIKSLREVGVWNHLAVDEQTLVCYVARRKGPACCKNKLPAPTDVTDAAVLCSIERALLHPGVVERALRHAERAITKARTGGDRDALQPQLTDTRKAMRRLSRAIAYGDELEALVTALQTHERQRADV